MKTLYLAVVEMAVYGWSFESENDAEQMALDWWESENQKPAKTRVMEFQCPDCMTEDDFNSCADYHDYESVIDAKNAEIADDDYIGVGASQELLDAI